MAASAERHVREQMPQTWLCQNGGKTFFFAKSNPLEKS